jgi:hypothetical protein
MWAASVAAACALFGGVWSLVHHGVFYRPGASDVPVYIEYGRAVVHGELPYRDFRLEYPPAAVPVFVVPALLDLRRPGYDRWFDREMLALGWLMVIAVGLCLRALGGPLARQVSALALVALTPLLIGPLMFSRFDLWPTTLTVLALATLLHRRWTIAAVLFGVAVAAKLWPAILLPVAVVWVLRRAGRRAAVAFSAVTAAVVASLFVPFAFLGPNGLYFSFHRQLGRPLQVESLGATILIALHHLVDLRIAPHTGWGSDNLVGTAVHATAVATTAAQAAALLIVWVLFARGPASHPRLLAAFAASIASFLAFGKVLSPQFLIWLAPFVSLLMLRGRLVPVLLAVAAFVLTQVEYPHHYKEFALYFHTRPVLDVLLRNISVVAMATLLIQSLRTCGSREVVTGVRTGFRRRSDASAVGSHGVDAPGPHTECSRKTQSDSRR